MTGMEAKQEFVDEQKIKEILIAIRDTEDHFDVLIKNEKNQDCFGYYNRRKNTIILYLLEYKSNNQLIGAAIHEYAHHFMKGKVGHKTEFWNCYFGLLEEAERKGLYTCNIDQSAQLKRITSVINQNDLVKNKKIFKNGTGFIFYIINKLCDEIDIDFQYYTVKYSGMEWYKKKNVYVAYKSFWRNYVSYNSGKIDPEEFLQKFFNDYDKK